MDRSNHYEAAFEAYLLHHQHAYVAVDETRRSQPGEESLKSLDFMVFGPAGTLLVDIKGRRVLADAAGRRRGTWETWTKQDDVDGLLRWQTLSTPRAFGLFVFAYELAPEFVAKLPETTVDCWPWKGRHYLLRAVSVDDYGRHLRVRSPKWGTVSLPARAFRQVVRPFADFLRAPGRPNTPDPAKSARLGQLTAVERAVSPGTKL